MKRAGKILLYFFIVFFFLFGIFHDSLLSYLFKNIIQEKSKGKIVLTIDSFHIGLHFGTVAIYKPVLLFEDLYVGESNSIKVEKIAFDVVKIEGLDLFSIIFKKEVDADRFFVDKPEFWLVENGTESKSKVQPEGFVQALKKNNDQFSEFKASIDDVEIHYGSVRITQDALSVIDPGQVDFTIRLEGFSTFHDTSAGDNIFYSNEFRFKLRHLNKLLSSGYSLGIDSIIFSSTNRDLIIDGVSYMPSFKRKGKNSIGFVSRQIVLNDIGLDELRKMNNVKLKSVLLSEGTFINYVNSDAEVAVDTLKNDSANKIMGMLNSISVDTVSISRFNYYNIKNENDTLISASNIDFKVTYVELDSSMQTNVIQDIGFEDVSLSTGYVNVKEAMPGTSISYNNFTYSNSDRALIVSGLRVLSDSAARNGSTINLNVPEYRIKGISMHKLQRNEKQLVSVYLDNPKGDFLMADSGIKENRKQQKNIFPLDLYFYEIVITNGNFNVANDSEGRADIRGLDMYITGMQLAGTLNDSIYFESVDISSTGISASLKKKNISIQVEAFRYSSGSLLLKNFRFQQEMLNGKTTFKAQSLGFSGFNKEQFLRGGDLYFDTLFFVKPLINGSYTYNQTETDSSEKKSALDSIVSPVQLNVKAVVFENGVVNTTVVINDKIVKLDADYNISVGAIDIKKGDTIKTVMESIPWRINVDNLVAGSYNHRLHIGNLVADSYQSKFSVKQVSVSPDATPDSSNIFVRSFTIPLLEVRGLDYNLLLWHDSLNCSAIQIEKPDIDISYTDNSVVVSKEKGDKLIDPADFMVLKYDTIEIAGLKLNLERKGEEKNETFRVSKLNFSHYNSVTGKDVNLISNVVFSLNELNYFNRLTSQSFVLKKCFIDRADNALLISKVGSYRINDDGSDVTDKKGIAFSMDDIELKGIMVESTLPTSISAKILDVKNVNLNIVKEKSEDNSKDKFSIDPDIMKRFSNVLSLLQLDTALMGDVSLNIRTINENDNSTVNLDRIGVFVEKIKLDTCLANMSGSTIIDQITIDLKGKTRISKDSLYEIHSGKLHYNFPDQKMVVDSFYLTPLYEPDEFFSKAVYQTDRVNLFVPRLEVDNINLNELVTKNHLQISSIDFYSVEAEMFRDKHYAIKPGMHKVLPREQIMAVKRLFTIDTIRIIDSYLKYKEMSEKADEPGEVYFDNINLSAYNLTNSLEVDEKRDLIIQFNGDVMGQAGIDMNIHFPLNESATSFSLRGKTDDIKLSTLNPLTTNLLGIGIVKGTGSVEVNHIEGSDSTALGSLVFRYKNLRLLPYSRNKEKLRSGALSPLLSFMINDLVVKSNNPKFARKPRVGQVYFVRDTRKGIINFIWKGVLSGVTSTLGFNNKDLRKVKKDAKRKQ